jgi:hypothetical protein
MEAYQTISSLKIENVIKCIFAAVWAPVVALVFVGVENHSFVTQYIRYPQHGPLGFDTPGRSLPAGPFCMV